MKYKVMLEKSKSEMAEIEVEADNLDEAGMLALEAVRADVCDWQETKREMKTRYVSLVGIILSAVFVFGCIGSDPINMNGSYYLYQSEVSGSCERPGFDLAFKVVNEKVELYPDDVSNGLHLDWWLTDSDSGCLDFALNWSDGEFKMEFEQNLCLEGSVVLGESTVNFFLFGESICESSFRTSGIFVESDR